MKGRVPRIWAGMWLALICAGLIWSVRGQGYAVVPGDILVANYDNGNVVKIDGWTGLTSQIGGAFLVPTDLVLADTGMLYVCEWGGSIQRLELSTGVVSTLVAAGAGPTELWGITLHSDGGLYVTSRFDDSVHRVDVNTGETKLVTAGGFLAGATGIASLDAEHVVVANNTGNRVVSISVLDGSQVVLAEGGVMDRPWGIAVNAGSVYVASYDRKELFRLDGGQAVTLGKLGDFPYGLAFDASGKLVIGLKGMGEAVVRVGTNGQVLRQFLDPKLHWVTGVDVSAITVTPPNSAPAAGLTVLSRPPGLNVKLPRTEFVGSDPDGDPLLVVEAGPQSTLGGQVALLSRYVGYVAPEFAAANDSFSFTLSDGRGGMASSLGVVVSTPATAGPSGTLTTEVLVAGGAWVRGDAIPGAGYLLQYGYGGAPATWYSLTNVTADALGRVEAFDPGATTTTLRTYRLIQP